MRATALSAALMLAFVAIAECSDSSTVLDESCYWRRYYRFGLSRVSPAVMKAEGQSVIGAQGIGKVQQNTEALMRQMGLDPAKADWRDHVLVANKGAREFIPTPAPIPPAEWTRPDFDDGQWVRDRYPFQGGRPARTTDEVAGMTCLGQYSETVDLRLQAAFYRGRFIVEDPQKATGLTVKLAYTGGSRVLVNDVEIARGHLPQGPLAADVAAEDYPAAAYGPNGSTLNRRTLGPVKVPESALVKGLNVLAIEIRASDVHPIVFTRPIQPNWGGPPRPWPHARLFDVELRGASQAVKPCTQRPAGVQVWAEDMHRRVQTTDFLPTGEPPGTVRFVGARNGAFSAQIVIGTDSALTGLSVKPGDMTVAGGQAKLAASCVSVGYLLPYPEEEFVSAKLGDERGLNASFPDAAALSRLESMSTQKPHIFDHISAEAPARIPAGTARPVWLTLSVPADAAPGTYKGSVEISAQGMTAVTLPVLAEISDWKIPAPKDYQTLVGCEENPYAVAQQYGVPLWSDKHVKLLEASFKELGQLGNKWINVPVLRNTEFGNKDDSPVKCIRKRDGSYAFDCTALDKYLDLAVKHCGAPRVVHFIVMHGMKSAATPPVQPEIVVYDESGARGAPMTVMTGGGQQEAEKLWKSLATSLQNHMKSKGLDGRMFWGAPAEGEVDPNLKTVMASAVPGIGWTAGPHEMMSNGTYAKNEQFYKLVGDIRYHGGWQGFRDDQGWKSRTLHPLNPRVGGTCFAIHATSHPFAFRVLPDRCLAMGRSGFTRVAADDWAAVHFEGLALPRWATGIPVLFMLWPGKSGAEPSARFEALREGIQEAEARIFIEQALDRGQVPPAVAGRARKVLADNFHETDFFMGNSLIYSLEQYDWGWQDRSRRLFSIAAEIGKSAK